MPVPFVDKPDRFSSDAIIPGRVSDPLGFVTENTIIEGVSGPVTLFFSVTGLRQLAERYPQVGLVSKDAFDLLEAQYDAEAEMLRLANEALDEATAKLDRISGLQRDGFKVARVTGRPPTKKAVA